MKTRIQYHNHPLPEILERAFRAGELKRLNHVGMHCGCEYTSFPIFKELAPYSRGEHSYGVMSIIYHFTNDIPSALSGAFHDIATPCFSHVIDFLHHDFEAQESTEEGTKEIINNSSFLSKLLKSAKIDQNDVNDYHRYPIADNDSPKLSADRLEYSLSNFINFGFASKTLVQQIYDDIRVSKNEFDEHELCFQSLEQAKTFGRLVLKNSAVYICEEDRLSMFALSYLIRHALDHHVIREADLYLDEPSFLSKLTSDPFYGMWWKEFRKLDIVSRRSEPDDSHFRIPAKRRYIDPFVIGLGRLSYIDDSFEKAVDVFLKTDFSICLGHPSFFKIGLLSK